MSDAHDSSNGPFFSPKESSTDAAVWRTLDLAGWGPEHCDWRVPSNVTVHADGTVVVSTAYVSNNWGSTANRSYMRFWVEVWLMNGEQRLEGPFNCGVAFLRGATDKSDIQNRYAHSEIQAILSQRTHFVVYQHIDGANEPNGHGIPLVTWDF
ncbi:hypothetical protein BurMR1_1904 [Burkholderia sp. MR1]|nr:hypothetical protein BurMR1_1904 [Burkholderia sp. MR1]